MPHPCRECHTPFAPSDEEYDVLARVSPVVSGNALLLPSSDCCPDCRLRSRLVHRNERRLYNARSALSDASILSLAHPDGVHGRKPVIYTQEEWWSDAWNGTDAGRPYDFSRPFFEQFQELAALIPVVNVVGLQNVNCDYAAIVAYCKNCYLINASENSEDCYYGHMLQRCRRVVDSSDIYDSEVVYEGFNLHGCHSCLYVSNSSNCRDCFLSDNLQGCSDCFLCSTLVRRQYCFLNQQLTPDDYRRRVQQVRADPGLWREAIARYYRLGDERIHKYAAIIKSEECSGDFITSSKRCHDCYDVSGCQDCRFVATADSVTDMVDCTNVYEHCELGYQIMSSLKTYHCAMDLYCYHGHDMYYSLQCWHSNNLFGCVGLKREEYCILNRRYSKAEYEDLLPRIVSHMRDTGEWGRFFPIALSPFAYNETVAYEQFPLTAAQARALGADWREDDRSNRYQGPATSIPDRIQDVSDDFCQRILGCDTCGKNYRIIIQELRFYREQGLPVPTTCWNCRYDRRQRLRNPRRLYDRPCDRCAAPMRTPHAPGQGGRVYCEACYLSEVQ